MPVAETLKTEHRSLSRLPPSLTPLYHLAMRLVELISAMEKIAPTRFAESWDNVGLLIGDPSQEIARGMLTIDYTTAVAREAQAAGCDVIIAYHPPIFVPLKRIDARGLIHDAMRRGVAIYSPHTALDVAEGGTNDVLCDILELTNRQPLRLAAQGPREYKLVTFVPAEQLEPVSQALFAAGAGHIGRYSSCSFTSPGTGTFFGEAGTNPAIGQSGKLEKAQEIRLETVVPIDKAGAVIDALRASHPYEEPAFDLVMIAAPPLGTGQGRIGSFEQPVARQTLLERIKRGLGLKHLLVAGPTDGMVRRAAVGAGSCGDMLSDAISGGAEFYLTGEMRHHDALRAAEAGLTVVCTLHSNSERIALTRLKAHLKQELPELDLMLAQADRDPFSVR
jgi:dinuclear metal center YbgI/SA1388 family protein